MNLNGLVARAAKLASNNSPLILTAIGVAGTIATAYLAARAAYKSSDVFVDKTINLREPRTLTTEEKFKATWKLYIPAVGTGVCTIACIIAANRIGTRRAAAMAAVVAISEKALDEYRTKVAEKFGETKERKVRDEIAQDRVTNAPPDDKQLVIVGSNVLCMDSYSGRYFQSDMESIRKIQNDLNWAILGDGSASLTDFYYEIGLGKTDVSDEVGWNIDNQLEIVFSAAMHEGKPVMVLTFKTYPIRDYYKFH